MTAVFANHHYVDTGTRCVYGKTSITDEFLARFHPNAKDGISNWEDGNKLRVFLEATRFPRDTSVESDGKLAKTQDYVCWVFGGSAKDVSNPDNKFHRLAEQRCCRPDAKTYRARKSCHKKAVQIPESTAVCNTSLFPSEADPSRLAALCPCNLVGRCSARNEVSWWLRS